MSIISDESEAHARTLCNRLALHRIARGLTQRDMARHFGDQQSNVQTLESMGRRPMLPTFIAYAWALDLEVGLVAPHHLPLLDLTADEINALVAGARAPFHDAADPRLRSALDKLTTTTEETRTDG